MSTPGQILAARVAEACQSGDVADAAGVAVATWASASAPRVFRGLGGYLSGRNRGRLPFLEFDVSSQGFAQDSADGGTLTSQVTLRAHCGGPNLEAAGDRLEGILLAALAAIRGESEDNYMALGDDSIAPLAPGPWGHQREATVSVSHSFNRESYEVE